MKNVNVVAAIICDNYDNKNKIFATQRGYGSYKDKWEFPGGKIEDGESPEEALKREIREELDAKISVHELLYIIDYDYPEFHLHMNCYWATLEGGEIKLLEHEAARWLDASSLMSVDWLPADLAILPVIAKALSGTIRYYNDHAEDFVSNTVSSDMSENYAEFLKLIPAHGRILDFGCGSGRDTKFFLDSGYETEAIDGSEELCRIASEYTGIRVSHMLFSELNEKDKYDGIWACASILHLTADELKGVLDKMLVALKSDGVIYTSFKYGTGERIRDGRIFSDFTEESFAEFALSVPNLYVIKTWTTQDVRPGRENEKWLNLIIKRSDMT